MVRFLLRKGGCPISRLFCRVWIVAFFLFVSLSNPLVAQAKRGCCSHHGGVCGNRCCDGTPLSAKCGGSSSSIALPSHQFHSYPYSSSTFHRSSYSHPSVASGKLNIKKPSKSQIRETEKFSGTVVKVVDGDTIIILIEGNKTRKIRLYGIDCPEKRQAFGKKAKKFTSSLVAGKNVKIVSIVNDRYGRIVALVYVDGVCVNQKIIEAGYAWVYTRYCDQQPLCSNWLYLELNARCFHEGLWSNKYPQAPWNFRKNSGK